MNPHAPAADTLYDLRLTKNVVACLPPSATPASMEDGYRVQASLVEKLLRHYGGRRSGYKVAATNVAAQQLMDVDAPFFGALLSATSFESPATLPSKDFRLRVVEAEFGFEMGRDVPISVVPYTADSIKPFIAAAIPSLEVVDHPFHDWKKVGAPTLAAANAIHGAWIAGTPVHDFRGWDLSTHSVSIIVNGTAWRSGSGANVMDNPLNVVAWLANVLPKQGRALRRGDRISTGTAAEVYFAEAGDRVTADFGGLGTVEVRFS
jgi:2-keto-4-pentenoate hydratase